MSDAIIGPLCPHCKQQMTGSYRGQWACHRCPPGRGIEEDRPAAIVVFLEKMRLKEERAAQLVLESQNRKRARKTSVVESGPVVTGRARRLLERTAKRAVEEQATMDTEDSRE